MAGSAFFSLGSTSLVLMEYQYTDFLDNIFPSAVNSFRKLENAYVNEVLILNNNDSVDDTGNVVDRSSVPINDNTYVYLDRDSARFLPSADDNITISDLTINPPTGIPYDTVRIHMASGYNFDDAEGFVFAVYLRTGDDRKLKLCDISYTPGDIDRVEFATKPVRVSDFYYDRYIEVKIPSPAFILDQQRTNPTSLDTISRTFDPQGLFNQDTVYAEYKVITTSYLSNGLQHYTVGENDAFAFANADVFPNIAASITEANDGDYFVYQATHSSLTLEDYMSSLNAGGGNYQLFHELVVTEQRGQVFTTTKVITESQTGSYDVPRYFRPIVLDGLADFFHIDYTVRLYSRTDGSSVIKSASLSSDKVGTYGRQTTKLQMNSQVGAVQKIYNRVVRNSPQPVVDPTPTSTPSSLYVPRYIGNQDVVIGAVARNSGNTAASVPVLPQSEIHMVITPFDNIYQLSVYKQVNQQYNAVDIEGSVTYALSFTTSNGGQITVDETMDTFIDRSKGNLLFIIPRETAEKVSSDAVLGFYLISRGVDGFETVVAKGTYSNAPLPQFISQELLTAVTRPNDIIRVINFDQEVSSSRLIPGAKSTLTELKGSTNFNNG